VGSFTANSVPSRTAVWHSSRSTVFSLRPFICILLTIFISAPLSPSQTPTNKPAPNSEAQQSAPSANSKPVEAEKNPAQIELLETKYRFESNGDSRKEVHTRVRINNELGVRQFARLNFDFNRSFQAVEIPLVHITHPSGGIADILPSAITDSPNPAVIDAPAYQDVRIKSVRILGLQPGDLLEYRVITTTTHHPLAPDFWLDHTFDRSGVVSEEVFELDLPAKTRIKINPETPSTHSSREGQTNDARTTYLWRRKAPPQNPAGEQSETNGADVSLSTFSSWEKVAERLEAIFVPTKEEVLAVREKTFAVSGGSVDGKTVEFYDFVSQKIKTVDLPLDATGFGRRNPMEILRSGYATAEDKFILFAAMSGFSDAGFVLDTSREPADQVPSPRRFSYLLTFAPQVGLSYWLDLNSEVAPIGMIPPRLRDKTIFVVGRQVENRWQTFKYQPVRPSSQRVNVNAVLDSEGKLTAKVSYGMRGDNELLLRVAFHKTPKERWKEIAQLLALSDGFRGDIINVTASDPYETEKPFEVEYEISQPKFVDWSKKNVRIPAILPLPGLPDAPAARQIEAKKPLELGTPLEIELNGTIQLPEGTTAQAPTGTSVERDYATFSSKYSAQGNTIHATRKLHFIAREIPATRAGDLNAFLHAVQADQTQVFTLQRTQAAER
jgi:hypothetical protein